MDGIVGYLLGILSNLWAAISGWLVDSVQTIITWFLDSVLSFLLWFTGFIVNTVDAIPVPDWLLNSGSLWSALPVSTLKTLHSMGAVNVFMIISGALVIRVLLNLFPSWLTRV